ncbi:MAG: glutamate-1-semialdehyde 2,1-aminomutase [Spirochaetaceae bacterium]|jgi:glutamate-1-semialdehyde 2,1-aminomutase|nr:glutamate-1-semialdehyde 2,1-aminomutase [Spirochaetaceae bacterium]
MTMIKPNFARSSELFAEALRFMPGGVNSPVRSFKAVGREPVFIKRADGAYIFDEDGNKYIDYVGSWGPAILGHNNPRVKSALLAAIENGLSFGAATEAETAMAKLLTSAAPSLEMVRLVNSGTEAVMSALRVARGFTGREKIIKFAGCYHGHSDALLVKAGSGLLSGASPDSAGVTASTAADTLIAGFNSLDSVAALFEGNKGRIAALILEPVPANIGVVLPEKGFLEGVRDICDKEGALLIFDEVITGFRLAFGGAQELFNIKPDISCFGKIIGAGLPAGAYGGRRDVMEMVAPSGPVYQAGTLSGNPLVTAAGIAQLSFLREHPEVYKHIETEAGRLFSGLAEIIQKSNRRNASAGKDAGCVVNSIGSIGSLFFTGEKVRDFSSALKSDTKRYAGYFSYMLDNGVYLAPAQFEALFVSDSHTGREIDRTLELAEDFFSRPESWRAAAGTGAV